MGGAMPIDRLPVLEIRPGWRAYPANRYESHPILRTAIIQMADDPEFVYVVTDQTLPHSNPHAVSMIEEWRASREATED